MHCCFGWYRQAAWQAVTSLPDCRCSRCTQACSCWARRAKLVWRSVRSRVGGSSSLRMDGHTILCRTLGVSSWWRRRATRWVSYCFQCRSPLTLAPTAAGCAGATHPAAAAAGLLLSSLQVWMGMVICLQGDTANQCSGTSPADQQCTAVPGPANPPDRMSQTSSA